MLNTLTRSAAVRPLLVLATILIAGSSALAQEQQVELIPRPRQITLKQDVFVLGNNTRIALASPRSEDDRFAVEDFQADLQETAKLSIKKTTSGSHHAILIGNIDLTVDAVGVESIRN